MTNSVRIGIVLAVIALAGCSSSPSESPTDTAAPTESETASSPEASTAPDRSRYEGTIAAPEFPAGIDWVNTSRPITWEDLRGKIVMLDFWTYGCINCIHMIPVLEKLQEKYSDELVVIGVHSAKFETEGSTENIRQIARRYGRREPIANDVNFQVWRSWGARAWPTIAVVDPRGNVLGMQAGELPYEALDEFVANVEARFDELGLIDRGEFGLLDPDVARAESLLLFPGKVLADETGGRLFISDSNHNRVIVTDIGSGEVLDVLGSGEAGFSDGPADTAQFHTPQGLALSGEFLYVADLDNHAIRQVDLARRSVRTLAGTGVRGAGRPTGALITDPLRLDLRSPWALEIVADDLYIAMAGTHQIWVYHLPEGTLEVAVGNGRESLLNDTLADSELAQPSGLFHTDGRLYFADSESSSIRVADLRNDRLETVSGPDRNDLFEYGDRDGVVGVSRLQHPLGVAGSPDGVIYITDTYNSRIKSIDPATNTTSTLFGLGGSGGYRDGGADVAEFDEPGGLDYADGKLYVADTNNHAVRVIDLESGVVDTLMLRNIAPLTSGTPTGNVILLADTTPAGLTVTLDETSVAAGPGDITVRIILPPGFKLNPLINSRYELDVENAEGSQAVSVNPDLVSGSVETLDIAVPADFSNGKAIVRVRLTLYYCESENEQACILDDSEIVVPVVVAEDGGRRVEIERTVELPDLPTFGEL